MRYLVATALFTECLLCTPSLAIADPCTAPVGYNQSQINTIKASLVTISQACTAQGTPDKSVWAAQEAIIEPIVNNHSDRTFANFLIAYFHGCYNSGVPPAFPEPLAKWFESRPFVDDANDGFERRLQRGIALAMVDRFLGQISAAGGVVALGFAMDGSPPNGTADCALRYDVTRTLQVLRDQAELGRRISAAMRDEIYDSFKALVDQETAFLWKNGISPDPGSYPWLGTIQAAVWRAMRFIRIAQNGDTLNRLQFATDIHVDNIPFYSKYRELLLNHGILLTDGESLTDTDPFVSPAYGTVHELGDTQLQIKAIDRQIDLYPTSVSPFIFGVIETIGQGNFCFFENNPASNTCVLIDPHLSCDAIVIGDGPVPCGVCSASGLPCATDRECQQITQFYGASGYSGSRCPMLQPTCPYAPYQPNTLAVPSTTKGDSCVLYGVNVPVKTLGGSIGYLVGNINAQTVAFPSDAPQPADPNRPTQFPLFGTSSEHEINHAVEFWKVRNDPALGPWQTALIDRACNVKNQYLYSNHSFCGDQCFNSPVSPKCTSNRLEFFASLASFYLTDTQRSLDLARTRWNANFKEPIDQFLFALTIYSKDDPAFSDPKKRLGPFFQQHRFLQPKPHTPQGNYTADLPAPNAYGLCQYNTVDAAFTLDSVGRIQTLVSPVDGKVHSFTYANSSLSAPVSSWGIS